MTSSIFRPAIASFSILLLLWFGSTLSADLITNGSFDTSVPTTGTGGGWTSSALSSTGWSGGGGNPGGRFQLNSFGPDSSDPTIEQTVPGLTIGSSYTLTWDYALHVNIAANGNSFGVFLDTQTDAQLLDNSKLIFIGENLSASYVTESVNFIAAATSHSLFFSGELDSRTNGGLATSDVSYLLDNVSLNTSAVPEPSSMFALCLMGVLGLHRNRRG